MAILKDLEFPLGRRDLLKWGGLAIAGAVTGPLAAPVHVRAQGRSNPVGTARKAILLEMSGAISPMDCWDLKDTKLQPKDLNPQKIWSDFYLSKTLFPKLIDSGLINRCSFVRSMLGRELVHLTGQYRVQTGRSLNPAVAKEIPGLGSVISYELDSQRRPSDTFPTYMSTNLTRNSTGLIGSGFLPNRFNGVDLDTSFVFNVFGGGGDDKTKKLLERRWETRRRLSEVSGTTTSSLGSHVSPYEVFYDYAFGIVNDPRWSKIFQVSDAEKQRYGTSQTGMGCLLARNLLKADAGTRFVYISEATSGNGPWDFHQYIYDLTKPQNLYTKSLDWDQAFTALLEDLAATPGQASGKTMLDETIIVSTSEFGRTPTINLAMGRDHYARTFTSLLVGGGIKGQRVLGKTNEDCSECIENGWAHRERPQIDNLAATIYSALGIDWKKVVHDTPSGRAYHYVQSAPIGSFDFVAVDHFGDLFA
jgi:hypothetical protein